MECGVPGVEIADDAVDAVAGRGVVAVLRLTPQGVFSWLCAPELRPSQKEALLCGEAVQPGVHFHPDLRRMQPERIKRQGHPDQICEVLAERSAPVQVNAG